MDIAIACHCSKPSPNSPGGRNPLLFIQEKNKPIKSLKSAEYKDHVTYISLREYCSPDDKDTKEWSEVSDNSVDIIWSRHCPIQLIFKKSEQEDYSDVFKDILTDGWRILRNNGKVYIPLATENYNRYTKELADSFMKTLTTNPWKTEIIDIKDSKIIIGESYETKPVKYLPSFFGYKIHTRANQLSYDDYSHIYVLTKSIPGGSTRSRKITLGRRRLNRATRRVKRHT